MTPQEFIAKWSRANLSERSACQQHFLDLCELLGQPKPAAADPDGAWYTFERGVRTTEDENGWADVWMRDHFGWEYKRKRKNLSEAYSQLLKYREALENPPLLVVCDLDRFEIHTNFTNTAKVKHVFDLAGLAEPANLDLLRKLFTEPEALRPGRTTESITREVARRFGQLADRLHQKGTPPHDAAHFLMKLMFCMFGEDVGLLPDKVFDKLLSGSKNDPAKLEQRLVRLFEAMCTGGDFGTVDIPWFNGGLFSDAKAIRLGIAEIETLVDVNNRDWSSVEPSIFGTLFERTLDPGKRAQIGAHYTSKEDIVTLLEPVMMTPLRREWTEVKQQCDELWPKIQKAGRDVHRKLTAKETPQRRKFRNLLHDFTARLAEIKILDPACGSGNFLYVAIRLLLDLEKEVISYAALHGESMFPGVRPTQLAGIEINSYAQELASVVIWIGYLQWMHDNGFGPRMNPVLEPIESIKEMDAILDLSDPEHPKEPEWPAADFIVSNPPFLGSRLFRRKLTDSYTEAVFGVYDDRLPRSSDLCCYWLEKARQMIVDGKTIRAGLLATQGVREGASQRVLSRIKSDCDIFFAISDRNWYLDGAAVHISMVGFDNGSEQNRTLDGNVVQEIHANLQSGIDLTRRRRLQTNIGLAFQGVTPMGPFEIAEPIAMEMLRQSINVHGSPNSDVIRRWANGSDLIEGRSNQWTVDFNDIEDICNASRYELPFEYCRETVLPAREKGETVEAIEKYWLHWRTRPEMRAAIARCDEQRLIVTPRVAKHRLFIWVSRDWLPSDATVAIAKSDDMTWGILQSRIHEVWVRSTTSQLREAESGLRYSHQLCFETFPFPDSNEAQREAISTVARELDQLRNNWLNPPEWVREEVLTFPGSVGGKRASNHILTHGLN